MRASAPHADARIDNVLVIDPQTFNRRLVLAMLGRLGCRNALQAASLKEALARATEHPVDIILIDWRMGRAAVSRLIALLRRSGHPSFRGMPVLVLAERVDRNLAAEIRELGADGIVVRPCSEKVLGERIRALLTRTSRLRAPRWNGDRVAYGHSSEAQEDECVTPLPVSRSGR